MDRMLSTEEAARRLGVKVPTLYAYVSRGLLESHPDPGRRGSLFDLDDIEGLAGRSRGGGPSPPPASPPSRLRSPSSTSGTDRSTAGGPPPSWRRVRASKRW